MATTVLQRSTPLTQVIYSNVKEVVEQGQYLFDTLWNTATPAEQKIRELEEGIKPPVIQVITDTHSSISRAFDIINSAKQEILVIFASAKTFLLAVEADALDHYQKALQRGVNVTILVPVEDDDDNDSKQQINEISHDEYDYSDGSKRTRATDSKNVIEHINKIKERIPKANLVMTDKSIKTRITILVVDNLESMVWELKDDTLDDPYQAGGIATYSNIPSIAFSYASIIHVISKQTELYKQLKESKERLEMLNKQLESHSIIQQEFINIAAHELRTPIQPILGLSEIALAKINKNNDDRTNIQLKEMLEAISRNARRLHTLTEDILDVTRIDSKILKLNKELVDIPDTINEVINDYRNKIDKTSDKEVELVSMIENHSNKLKDDDNDTMIQNDFEILDDKDRIIQILSNLVSTAIKFSPNKGTITVSKEVRINDRSIVINVADRGKGIEPDIFPRLFLKFSTKSDHGTGLGLYICKSLVEAQGGRIWAQNNMDGPGATFSFSLPLAIYPSE
jgi:two-component system, OmpR family, sensor histidine kinase VicK